MKQRIYIDTSVVGGYFDEEFKEATSKLFDRLEDNEIKFVVSDLLDLELLNAPQNVKEHLLCPRPEGRGYFPFGKPERVLVRAILQDRQTDVGIPSDPTYVTVNP
ncbi:MAG: hypothetical protein WBD27_00930 [Pyrinomonadaceae bacterium]